MMNSVLERMPIEKMDGGEAFDEVLSRGCDDIVREAEKRFYNRRVESWRHDHSRQDIMTALSKIGVRPFTNESVSKYKSKIDNRLAWRNLPARSIVVMAIVGCIGGAISSFVLCVSAGIVALLVSSVPAIMAWAMIICPLCLLVGIGLAALSDHIEVVRGSWQTRAIAYVDIQSVPEFALQTALDLDTCCPGCDILIEDYEERKEKLDPFLLVYIHGTHDRPSERIYLEVWDEIGFERDYQPNWLSFS